MIRVLALYSQCKQHICMFSALVIYYAAASRLACALKTLLGLEAIIKLTLMVYGTMVQNSKLLINLNETELNEFTQPLSSALVRKVPRCAGKSFLHRWRFLWGLGAGEFEDEALDIPDTNIGSSRWCMGSYSWL